MNHPSGAACQAPDTLALRGYGITYAHMRILRVLLLLMILRVLLLLMMMTTMMMKVKEHRQHQSYHHRIIKVLFMPLTISTMNQRLTASISHHPTIRCSIFASAISQHFWLFHPSMVARWFLQVQLLDIQRILAHGKHLQGKTHSFTASQRKWREDEPCLRMFQMGWNHHLVKNDTSPDLCCTEVEFHLWILFIDWTKCPSVLHFQSEQKQQPKKQLIQHLGWFWISIITVKYNETPVKNAGTSKKAPYIEYTGSNFQDPGCRQVSLPGSHVTSWKDSDRGEVLVEGSTIPHGQMGRSKGGLIEVIYIYIVFAICWYMLIYDLYMIYVDICWYLFFFAKSIKSIAPMG